MAYTIHRNITSATVCALRDIAVHGETMVVRGQEVRELRNRITVLTQPHERCIFLPHRGNDVFASLAETLWVLAGRSDIAWLSTFLPRAVEFSDDGMTWRAGYGPRFRDWNGIDQLNEARKQLLGERLTRRAVISLFDPDRDFVQSKDIPCNNWLQWLVRGDHLHLNIAVRSNDVWWGFSGVNAFEWSVLQEVMAFWIGAPVGEATYFATSLHLYQRHYEKAAKAMAAFNGITCYDYGIARPQFTTPWEAFDSALDKWFAIESQIRRSPNRPISKRRTLEDPFLNSALQMVCFRHGMLHGWDAARMRDELAAMEENDLTAAAYVYVGRKYPAVLEDIAHPRIAAFILAYRSGHNQTMDSHVSNLKDFIKTLHREKDAGYGSSWKRRGELTSILANVARKIDRLETYATASTKLVDEPILDTAIDLFVYLIKYRLYLMEASPASAAAVLPEAALMPFSDHPSNFDALLDQIRLDGEQLDGTATLTQDAMLAFEQLHQLATVAPSERSSRLGLTTKFSELAWRLIIALIREQPERLEAIRRGRSSV